MSDDKIRSFYQTACEKLDEIDALIKPGAKLTLIIRRPEFPGQDVLITTDDYAGITSLLERRLGKSADPATREVT